MTQYELARQYATQKKISVHDFSFSAFSSCAIELDERYAIGLDQRQLETESERLVAITHELGHIETASLVSMRGPFDPVERNEHRAWKWTIERLLPRDRLKKSLRECGGRLWDVAEQFDVTEALVRRALSQYGLDHS